GYGHRCRRRARLFRLFESRLRRDFRSWSLWSGRQRFRHDQRGHLSDDQHNGQHQSPAYTISGVALDSSYATGQTAYVTIMGFHVPHVFKTTNAGQSWSDFSGTGAGALPDSPANAVVIAPGANTSSGVVFVATDTGV